ncbi:OsmC family protein [Salinicoccus sp. ID82-1]|uniref:Osmotically inducible protein OsmC n=1 Tax=Salinicoccus cyprini TaxID=2493691 RepID=A0A558AV38_9STAP|nr:MULTISPECIES: OsmC family protein [Salinicoccus]MCG1010557.1 OsmC family protein [Salinicoccus sp. ID82-1]TVT28076.1 osmotically inducible protein OsmC [Salinicoccus cyprini]
MANQNITLETVWNGNQGEGVIHSRNIDTKIAIPEAMGGTGAGTDPKEMLISSAAACYSMTLASMLEARKLPVTEFTMRSEAGMTEENNLQIVHYPQITLSAEATEKEVQSVDRAFSSADKACAVGNILKKADNEISIEGSISVGTGE